MTHLKDVGWFPPGASVPSVCDDKELPDETEFGPTTVEVGIADIDGQSVVFLRHGGRVTLLDRTTARHLCSRATEVSRLMKFE